jgi:hypothetical protein
MFCIAMILRSLAVRHQGQKLEASGGNFGGMAQHG